MGKTRATSIQRFLAFQLKGDSFSIGFWNEFEAEIESSKFQVSLAANSTARKQMKTNQTNGFRRSGEAVGTEEEGEKEVEEELEEEVEEEVEEEGEKEVEEEVEEEKRSWRGRIPSLMIRNAIIMLSS